MPFPRHFPVPNNKYSIKADQVITAKQKIAFLFSVTGEQDLAPVSERLLCQFALGQSGVQPLGCLSPQPRLHPLPDVVEPLLRRRQQLAAEPRGVFHF